MDPNDTRSSAVVPKRTASQTFVGDILSLAGASFLAKLASVLLTPIFTRIYSADHFGALAVFMSIVGIASQLTSVQYHRAIPLVKNQVQAVTLSVLSLGFCGILSTITALVAISLYPLFDLGESGGIFVFSILVFTSTFTDGAFTAIKFWYVRLQLYRPIAIGTLIREVPRNGVFLLGGVLAPSSVILFLGDAIGRTFGMAYLVLGGLRSYGLRSPTREIKRLLLPLAKRYFRFSLTLSLSQVLYASPSLVLPLIIAATYGAEAAGFFAIAYQTVLVGVAIVSQAIAQTFFGHMANAVRSKHTNIRAIYWRSFLALMIVVGFPLLLLAISAETAFGIVLGSEWTTAGSYFLLLSPAVVLQATVGPIFRVLTVLERTSIQLLLDASVACAVAGLIFAAKLLLMPISAFLLGFSCISGVGYLMRLFTGDYAIRRHMGQMDLTAIGSLKH
jgi:O-antigen/teichoic acid export membrane protein